MANMRLHIACRNGNLDEVSQILNSVDGSGLNELNLRDENDNMPLHIAVIHGYIHIAQKLLEHGADINDAKPLDNSTPLFLAVVRKDLQMVQFLLTYENLNVNTKKEFGVTTLHEAAYFGSLEIVRALLTNKNINVDARTRGFRTPLHHVAERYTPKSSIPSFYQKRNIDLDEIKQIDETNKYIEIIKLLLKNGADVYSKDAEGATPLHTAARNGFLSMIKFLLDYSLEFNPMGIDAKDSGGNTPLHYAALFDEDNAVKLLLSYGASYDIQNKGGTTALSKYINKDELIDKFCISDVKGAF